MAEVLTGENPQLQVYCHNIQLTLVALLANIYPVVARLVGKPFFARMAKAFVQAHVPSSGNMHDYGHAFAGFISAYAPADELPYLSDVARLEWAWHCAFYAPAHTPRRAKRVMAGDVEGMVLAPCVFLVRSAYPIVEIWRQNKENSNHRIQLDVGGDDVLLYRTAEDVVLWSLTPIEAAFFEIFAQQDFAAAISQIDEATSQRLFSRLLQAGLLV